MNKAESNLGSFSLPIEITPLEELASAPQEEGH
jgi:hypothetical protein